MGNNSAPLAANGDMRRTTAASRAGQVSWALAGAWLGLRLVTLVWAALASTLRPLTTREATIPLWPPSAPYGSWLERAVLAPWERWDTGYYLSIVERGYRADDGTAQFHPLLAWLALPIAWLTGQPLLALMVVSSLASLLLLLAFEQLARLDLAPAAARTGTLLLLASPLAFVLFAPYTEGLFMLWAVLCLLCARRGRWWLAGLAGALAVLTRQQGVFLALPLAWELWEAAGRQPRRALAAWRSWLALCLIPGGLVLWLIYRAVALGDLHASFSDPQALIFSLLISPSSSKVVPVQAFLPPWQALYRALGTLRQAPEASIVVDLVFGGGFVGLVALAWRHLRTSYRIYVVAIVLVSFGYWTGPIFPYMGLPRHLLLAFPVFVGLAPVVLRRRWRQTALTAAGLLGLLFLQLLYVLEAWTP